MTPALSVTFRDEDRRNQALTARQAEVLTFVQTFTRRHGFAPTIREIAAAVRIASTNGVADHLKALRRKGFVGRGKNKQRSVVVLKNADGTPAAFCPTCRRPS